MSVEKYEICSQNCQLARCYASPLMSTGVPQFCINGSLVDQLIVSPPLDNLSLLDHIDLVGAGSGVPH